MKNEPFIIERTYNAPVEKVWSAISDHEEMLKWYFNIDKFKPEVGFEFSFEGGDDKQSFLHLCRVTKAEPNKVLAYTWRYDGYRGNSEVIFELFPEGDKTRLKLTHTGLETFPQDNPLFRKESFAGGWNEIIGTLLKTFVEKETD
ncbi:MAG: SRPBCC domain-containing protein [Sphingobacteriales bacterium]|nr:MAG: SRPBCC domain-containing protein [Sphingobacteriales bacterium]